MKVLVADKFEKSGLDGLAGLGVEVIYEPDLKDDSLQKALVDTEAEVLVVRSTKVTAPMVEAKNLALIVRAGAGYNTIDVAAASDRGIFVSNCPGKNGIAVAELALGLMLACDRHIPDNVISLRQGKWNKKEFSKAKGLYGRTLGLIGFGNIAQEVFKRGRAFGMNVAVNSRWMTPEIATEVGVTQAKTLEELASLSDFISVHIALNPQTKGLLSKSFFAAMRPGCVFINTSRAEVVDQAAMLAALEEKGLKAGLDVFDEEPTVAQGDYAGTLKDDPHVYATHHIGASTDQAQDAVAAETVRIVKEFKNTGHVPNVVNVAKGETATHLLIVRHADKVGVLAGVLEALKQEGVSVQEMENIVMGGAKAAIAQISTSKEPSANVILAIKKNQDIFDAHTIPLPGK